jgi:tetratricopeptide (TPR) repeat protein
MRVFSLIAVLLFVSSLAAPSRAGMVEDCVQTGDWNLKISGCTEVIRSGQYSGKDLVGAYNNRGVAYKNLGEYRRAIQDYDQALRLDPGYAVVYSNRGVAYGDLGEYRRAIQDHDQALRLDPDDAIAYTNRGEAYRNLGEYRRAIADHDQALRLDPGSAIAYNNRAWALYLVGRNAEALGDVDRSLSLRPGDPAIIDTRAHVLAALGRRNEALNEFERVMRVGGADWVRTYQEALAKHGYYRGAIDGGAYRPQTKAALGACLEAGCRLLE